MPGYRWRILLWIVLLICSILIHAFVSWYVGLKIKQSKLPISKNSSEVILKSVIEPNIEKIQIPEEQLEFEENINFEPPEILLSPKTLVPPPPDVSLSLKAQSSGFQGIDIPKSLAFVAASKGDGIGGFKSGIGNSLGNGTARFAPYIGSLRESGLDVVFCIDATGSMGWVLDEVKSRIEDINQIVRSLVPIARFGFVAYRDYDNSDFLTRIQPLTYSTSKLYRFLSNIDAEGGGDWFEAIDAGLKDSIEKSDWRIGARKLIILIGDAPPRDNKLDDIIQQVRQFQSTGGTVSTLDVSEQANPQLLEAKLGRSVPPQLYRNAPMHAFLLIGEAGHGDAATLDGDIKLTKRLVKLIMGDKFAPEIQALLDAL